MQQLSLRSDSPELNRATGKILCHDVRGAGRRGGVLFKGSVLTTEDVQRLGGLPGQELHLVALEEGDLTEEEAARRLATAVAGPGLRLKGPHQSRYGLVAARRGVLRVKADALQQINSVEYVSVYTWF